MPFFDYHGVMCAMASFKQHCSMRFWKGAQIPGLAPDNANGEAMGNFGRITSIADLPSKQVLAGFPPSHRREYVEYQATDWQTTFADDSACVDSRAHRFLPDTPARESAPLSPVRPMRSFRTPPAFLVGALLVAAIDGCGGSARMPLDSGIGPTPEIGEPHTSLIPTVHVAEARGWADGAHPTAAPGTTVRAFATNLDHPRWIYVLPNGDVLVAETNAPPKPDDNKGIKGWFFKKFQQKAGAGVPSANRITLLRDADGDGVAETRSVLLDSLHSPFGMALVGNTLYVANSDALVRFSYNTGDTRITAPGVKVVDLPAGTINHHWTKNVIASHDGSTLYVTVGSNSNAAENGIEVEAERAAVWQVDPATGAHRVFASGLRNPVGMAWSETGALWVAVNERDELGSDLVPDYMTAVKDGAFYGWPYSYYGAHVDARVHPERPDLVATAIVPDYALGAHTASLGLANAEGNRVGAQYAHGMFVGQHGSWNRKPFSGYRVIFVPFTNGRPSGLPVEVLTGFLDASGDAQGRPVGVAVDRRGGLLVADDVGNTIWRVTSAP